MSAGGQLSTEQIQDALQRANKLAEQSKQSQAMGGGGGGSQYGGHDEYSSGMMAGGGMSGGPMGGSMQGMSPGGVQDNHCETIEVPDSTVGLIIGRGGEQISNIQTTSHCRVQMAPDSGGQAVRQCTLHGTQESIEKAKEMIQQIIERAGSRGPPHGGPMGGGGMGGMFNGSGGMGMGNRAGQVTAEMMIPGQKCGLIIGKGGETIKGLQEKANVKMVMIQDDQQATGMPKPLRITGDPEKVDYAKQLVEELLSRQDGQGGMGMGGGHPGMGGMYGGGGGGGYGGPGGRSMGEVIVPRSSVGLIIGKGGDMIKKLAADTGARIQFKNDEAPEAEQRTAVIHGTVDQIQRATQLITDLVSRSQQNGEPDVFYMHVPANKTGLVIGRGGETIKSINAEAGAHVELSRDDNQNATEKVFVIKGTAYQIHVATHLIRIKVGDIPQGTPIPPFAGPGGATAAGATANQYGGAAGAYGQQAYGQQQPQAQQAWQQQAQYGANGQMQANAGGDPNAQWAQYYTQQQMQQAGAQPQQQYQQPGAQSAAAVNPSTGQPDYSQQWIEYYRSMGMHDQAAVIEAQTRGQQRQAQPQQQQAQYGGFTTGAGSAQNAQPGTQYTAGYTSGTAAAYPQAYQ